MKRIYEQLDERYKDVRELIGYLEEGNGLMLSFAGEKFRRDKDVVRAAVRDNGHAFEFADEALKRDVAFINELLKISGRVYYHIPRDVREADPEMFFKALEDCPYVIRLANKEQKADVRTLQILSDSSAWRMLEFVDGELLDNDEIVEDILDKEPGMFFAVSERLRGDRRILNKVLKRGCYFAYDSASEEIKKDREFAKECLKLDCHVYQYLSEEFRNDRVLSLMAVKPCGMLLEFASDAMKDDDRVVEAALSNEPSAYLFASERFRADEKLFWASYDRAPRDSVRMAAPDLKNDRAIALKILKDYPRALKYFSDRLRDDYDVVKVAADSMPSAIEFASDRIKNDFKIMAPLIEEDLQRGGYDRIYARAGSLVRMDKKLALMAVSTKGMLLRDVPLSFRDDEDVVRAAVTDNGNAYMYASKRLRENEEIKRLAEDNRPYSEEGVLYD